MFDLSSIAPGNGGNVKNHHIRYNAWYKISRRWHQYYINRCIQRRENVNPQ